VAILKPSALPSAQSGVPLAPSPVSFAKDVQPILENNCLSCHGDAMQMGGLDLRSRESALQGGAHGAVLLPANAEQSKLYRMVASLERPSMPMSGKLTAQDIATLKGHVASLQQALLGPARIPLPLEWRRQRTRPRVSARSARFLVSRTRGAGRQRRLRGGDGWM